LGYFQAHAYWRKHVAGPCALVRRQTGGGAILHDRELTYGLVLPPGHPAAGNTAALYDAVHHAFIGALGRFGISAELHGRRDACDESKCDAFYCFQRRSPSDVVIPVTLGQRTGQTESDFRGVRRVGPRYEKICGSAQRRRKGAVLMHGSVPLAASAAAPQILGIKEVTGTRLPLEELRDRWAEELIAAFDFARLESVELPGDVRLAAQDLADRKYARSNWTDKR
jgi:lipoate-protein ligase A